MIIRKLKKLEKPSKSKLEKLKFILPKMEIGQCIFIPNSWHFAIQADSSWSFVFLWSHFTEKILDEESECFADLGPQRTPTKKYRFINDLTNDFADYGKAKHSNL